MQEWKWSAEKILHVYRTYFKKKFPFTGETEKLAADEASLGDDDRLYLHRMVELGGEPQGISFCSIFSGCDMSRVPSIMCLPLIGARTPEEDLTGSL